MKNPNFISRSLILDTAYIAALRAGKTEHGDITVICERFASIARQHNIAMKYTFSADFDCEAEIITGIDGDVWDINGPHFCENADGEARTVLLMSQA